MENFDMTTPETGLQALGKLDIEDCDGYNPITETLHLRCDTDDDESVLLGIVGVIAELSGQELFKMTPLYDAIDVESLLSMLRTVRGDHIEVAFTYEGYPISVSSSGEIVVQLTT